MHENNRNILQQGQNMHHKTIVKHLFLLKNVTNECVALFHLVFLSLCVFGI